MSLFAGIYSIKDYPIDDASIEILLKTVADSQDCIETFSNSKIFLAKFDFGAFEEKGFFFDERKGLAAISGEPFLNNVSNNNFSRLADLHEISEHISRGKLNILGCCNGTYSMCYYNPHDNTLILATDKLGVRPVYYYYNDDFLYFSSCLKILENIYQIPKRLDVKAFIEQSVFGLVLGNKTQYCDIKVLRDGQYLKCQNENCQLSFYFRWDELPITHKSLDSILKESYSAFESAVACRSKRNDPMFALLSGGLDSRCIVSVLHLLGKKIVALNSFLPGEPDEIFAEQYARRIGIDYIGTQCSPDVSTTERLLTETISDASHGLKKFRFPRLVFSGDGGSVGIGHVYMDETLLSFLRNGNIDSAIHYYLRDRQLPKKIIKSKMLSKIKNIPFEGVKEELLELTGVVPGRDFFLFLLRNDQRCHLHKYYENIDQNRVELLLPFYDSRLLEIIVSAPVEPFLNHNFYHNWLNLFPVHTRLVPWQTYPGHLPCALPEAKKYPSQWEAKHKNKSFAYRASLKKCLKILSKKDFPDKFVSRHMVLIAILLHIMKIGDYSYIFTFVIQLYTQYSKCTSMPLNLHDNNNPSTTNS